MTLGSGTPVAVARENSVVTPLGKLTKSRGNSTTSGQIESARVSLESGERDESNGIWLEAVALPWQSIGRML